MYHVTIIAGSQVQNRHETTSKWENILLVIGYCLSQASLTESLAIAEQRIERKGSDDFCFYYIFNMYSIND
jgi:hypothetical protein